jgi:Ca2+-binding EF-hand superfamily protein
VQCVILDVWLFPEPSKLSTMKIDHLPTLLAAATLFIALGGGLNAQAATDARPGARKGRAAELLQRFDTNGDGRIDEDERATARETMRSEGRNRPQGRRGGPGNPAEMRAQMLERFDADKDGQLNDEEREEVGNRLASNPQVLQRFDANGDGQLDNTERAAARAAMEERMKSGRAGKDRRPGRRQQ